MQWALSVFFRKGSKNSFQTSLEKLKPQCRVAVLNYLGLVNTSSFPHRSVVDDFLATIDPAEVNDLLIQLFIFLQKNKVFYNHSEILLPCNMFHLASMGFMYTLTIKPHSMNEKGENICPYCLPRKKISQMKKYILH